MLNRAIPILLFCLLTIQLSSQKAIYSNLEVKYLGEPLKVFQIECDSLGFLWLGTDKGVFRYDGRRAVRTISQNQEWMRSKVSKLHIDGNTIIAGYASGGFWSTSLSANNIAHQDTSNSNEITSILRLNSTLLLGTYGNGLLRYNHSGEVNQLTTQNGLVDDYLYDIIQSENEILVATDRGVNKVRYTDWVVTDTIGGKNELPDNMITAVSSFGEAQFIGTYNGHLVRLRNNGGSEVLMRDNSPVTSVLSKKRLLWVGFQDGKVLGLDPENGKQPLFETQSENEEIEDLCSCGEGNLLVARGNSRIQVIDSRFARVNEVGSFHTNNISAITSLGNKLVWARNDALFWTSAIGESKGIQTITLPFKIKSARVVSLLMENEKILWAGTFDEGLYRIDLSSREIIRVDESRGLDNLSILSLSFHGEKVWAATLGGLFEVNPEPPFNAIKYGDGSRIGNNYIYMLDSRNEGPLWIGTDGVGLAYKEQELKFPDYSSHSKTIYTLVADGDSVWFANAENELFKATTDGEIQALGKAPAHITQINSLKWGGQDLVAFGNGGLMSLSSSGTREFSVIPDCPEGIESDYFNTMTYSSGFLWIATKQFLLRFNNAQDPKKAPHTYITGIYVDESKRDTTGPVELSADENFVSFDFSGLYYRKPTEITYRYILEGQSREWEETREHRVNYSQLRPGNYTFRVQSSVNKNHGWSPEASIEFSIKPPFYMRWWFFTGCAIVLMLIVYSVIRFRERQLKLREAIARERIQSQFDVLRNQINPHFLFNSFNTLSGVITSDPKKATEYVEYISEYFRIILEHRQKDLIALDEELDLVEKYTYLQKMRFGNNLELKINLNREIRTSSIPPLTLQLLLENAIKHNIISNRKPLLIEIFEEDGFLVVRNNLQRKPSPSKGTGVGIQNIKNRYKLMLDKEVEIEESENLFSVKLPLA